MKEQLSAVWQAIRLWNACFVVTGPEEWETVGENANQEREEGATERTPTLPPPLPQPHTAHRVIRSQFKEFYPGEFLALWDPNCKLSQAFSTICRLIQLIRQRTGWQTGLLPFSCRHIGSQVAYIIEFVGFFPSLLSYWLYFPADRSSPSMPYPHLPLHPPPSVSLARCAIMIKLAARNACVQGLAPLTVLCCVYASIEDFLD